MLLRQHQFPREYHDSEIHVIADSDRLMMHDFDHAQKCYKKHTGTGERNLENWLMETKPDADKIFKFLKDILRADKKIIWTGFRIMGGVHRGDGYVVWTFDLFAKDPNLDTVVYSEEEAFLQSA